MSDLENSSEDEEVTKNYSELCYWCSFDDLQQFFNRTDIELVGWSFDLKKYHAKEQNCWTIQWKNK